MSVREPILKPVAIADLRPTQMTVGIREVEQKRKRWHDESKKKGDEFLGKHTIPIVLGPGDRHYVIDHHHLARALHDEGVENILVTVVEKLRKLEPELVLVRPEQSQLDASVRRRGLPASLQGFANDRGRPQRRSVPLVGRRTATRRRVRQGHDTVQRILWANFLRRRVERKTVEAHLELSSPGIGQKRGGELPARLFIYFEIRMRAMRSVPW